LPPKLNVCTLVCDLSIHLLATSDNKKNPVIRKKLCMVLLITHKSFTGFQQCYTQQATRGVSHIVEHKIWVVRYGSSAACSRLSSFRTLRTTPAGQYIGWG
jgi:hypothetical protein